MIHTLTGKNDHALSAHVKMIVSKFAAQYGDMALERIDASELHADEIISRSSNLPFLAEKKLVIVRDVHTNTALMEKIETLVDRTPEQVDVYLIGAFDKRKSNYKDLKKHTQLKEFTENNPRDLAAWGVDYANEHNAKLTSANAQYLIDRIGVSQQRLAREIEKLTIGGGTIDRERIDTLTNESIEESIFSMLDAVFSGDAKQALSRYRQQRASQVDPHYIVAMITWQLQQLSLAVFAPDQSAQTLTKAGMSSFAAGKMQRLAGSVSKADLRRYVVSLTDTDQAIKNGAAIDADAAVENFIIEITSK